MNISIIICCYNSATRIGPTLEHLAKQELGGLGCEVILVNNNCTDDTIRVAQSIWKEVGAPFSLNVIDEKEPGLSYARKAGVLAAQGEIVIFCDDDNWLDYKYCKIVSQLFSSKEIGIIGGLGEPVYEEAPESWFLSNNLVTGMATGRQSQANGKVLKNYVYGAGMAIRRSIFILIQNIGFLLDDRKGSKLLSGGDVELC
jgi:glycosyltransferase involved in cell wall biosynthesis